MSFLEPWDSRPSGSSGGANGERGASSSRVMRPSLFPSSTELQRRLDLLIVDFEASTTVPNNRTASKKMAEVHTGVTQFFAKMTKLRSEVASCMTAQMNLKCIDTHNRLLGAFGLTRIGLSYATTAAEHNENVRKLRSMAVHECKILESFKWLLYESENVQIDYKYATVFRPKRASNLFEGVVKVDRARFDFAHLTDADKDFLWSYNSWLVRQPASHNQGFASW